MIPQGCPRGERGLNTWWRNAACRAAVLAAGTATVVWLAGAALAVPARAAARPTQVTVTITRSRIRFTPSYVPRGTLVFTVFNRTERARDFGVGARRTGAIAAGHSVKLTMTLTGKGARTFSSVPTTGSPPITSRLTGALYLYEACEHPAVTTVDVRMAESPGGLVLSQASVPCGAVTFVVTDVDTPATSLLVSIVVPPRSAVTNQLDPGQTASMTVHFAAKAVVDCDAVADDSDGNSVIVGHASLTLT